MDNKQAELRKEVKFLKGSKDISYIDMAKAIGISKNSFYNFVSGRKAKLGYGTANKLIDYIRRIEENDG